MANKLYTLIKSLNKSEKRYFVRYAEKHVLGSENKYLHLFRALAEQQDYEEEKIIETLRQAGYATSYLAADKNYLYRLLLRCLNEYHHNKTYNLRIKSQLQSIELLFLRGLYKDCLSLIKKTEKVAKATENYYLLLDILRWKKKCLGYTKGLASASAVNQELKDYTQKLVNLQQITDLYYHSYALRLKHGNKLTGETAKAFGHLLTHPLLAEEKNAKSLSAKVFYYLIFSHYFFINNEYEEELGVLEKLLGYIHNSKVYRIENPLDYLAIYSRLLSLKKYIRDSSFYEDIAILRDFAQQKRIRNHIIEGRVFLYTYTHELEFLLMKGEFNKARLVSQEVERGLQQIKIEVEPFYRIHFHYMLAVVQLVAGEYTKALGHCNIILNTFEKKDRPRIFIKTEVLNALLHFELQHYEHVSYLVKNLNRRYAKESLYSSFEKKLLKKVAQVAVASPTYLRQIQNAFSNFLMQLPSATENLSATNVNYLRWVKAQVTGKSILHLVNNNKKDT